MSRQEYGVLFLAEFLSSLIEAELEIKKGKSKNLCFLSCSYDIM